MQIQYKFISNSYVLFYYLSIKKVYTIFKSEIKQNIFFKNDMF